MQKKINKCQSCKRRSRRNLEKARMEAHNIISLSEKKADERKEEILKEATTQEIRF